MWDLQKGFWGSQEPQPKARGEGAGREGQSPEKPLAGSFVPVLVPPLLALSLTVPQMSVLANSTPRGGHRGGAEGDVELWLQVLQHHLTSTRGTAGRPN